MLWLLISGKQEEHEDWGYWRKACATLQYLSRNVRRKGTEKGSKGPVAWEVASLHMLTKHTN